MSDPATVIQLQSNILLYRMILSNLFYWQLIPQALKAYRSSFLGQWLPQPHTPSSRCFSSVLPNLNLKKVYRYGGCSPGGGPTIAARTAGRNGTERPRVTQAPPTYRAAAAPPVFNGELSLCIPCKKIPLTIIKHGCLSKSGTAVNG